MTALELGPDTTETRAREARYRWLKALARERKAWLFTAHHRDDQVETVLMRVLKGSGPAGLAGIAAVSGKLVRPLFPFGHEEIRGWLDVARNFRGMIRPIMTRAISAPGSARSCSPRRARIPALDPRLIGLAAQSAADRAGWDAVIDLLGVEWSGTGRDSVSTRDHCGGGRCRS